MEIIQRIWQENKRFILQVGGALAVFLILQSCVNTLVGTSADSLKKKNVDAEKEVQKIRSRVVQALPEERKNLEEYADIEKELARFQTPLPADVPDPKRGAPHIQFSDRIDKVWSDIRTRANQRNVKIPEKINSTDLGIAASVGAAPDAPSIERAAAYLEILARAMKTCVESGLTQIDKPTVNDEELGPILENSEEVGAVYRRVGLTVQGPYDAFKKVLREFQNPPFMQARLISLDTRGAAGSLRGQMEFVGFFVEKPGETVAAAEPDETKGAPKEPKSTKVRKAPKRKKT